jgi:hypothetical protein
MWSELAAVAAAQAGLFTRAQAIEAGFRGPAIRQLLAPAGDWVVVRRGVYMERSLWQALDPYRGRPLVLARAVQLSLRTEHVLSHDSAAYAWRLPVLTSGPSLVHVTRPGVQGSRTEHGVKHHLERRGLDGVYAVEGLLVTGRERAGLDIAREHGWVAGVVALDGALRRGARVEVIEAILAGMWSWPRVRQARRAAAHARLGAESGAETLMRLMTEELGLGEATPQFPVQTRNGTGWADLRIGRHLFEFDGRQKYVDVANGGYADRPLEDLVWAEKVRESDFTAQGLGVSRFFWRDCHGPGRAAGLARMASEYAATVRRLGTELPDDVAAFADRMSERRDQRLRRDFLDPERLPLDSSANPWRRAG